MSVPLSQRLAAPLYGYHPSPRPSVVSSPVSDLSVEEENHLKRPENDLRKVDDDS